jgi:hypothetical protein
MVNDLIKRYIRIEELGSYPCFFISDALSVVFSDDFIQIAKSCRFDYLGRFEWFFSDNDEHGGVIDNTKYLIKEYGLSKEYLYLADDGTSALFMKCLGDREEIWNIAEEDIGRLCEGEPLLYEAVVYKTFPEFFEYLLEQREEEIKNEK